MKRISNASLGRKNLDAFRAAAKTPVIIVLDNVRSMHNVGAVFRTADAFLCEAVYLCGITASPPHREIEKTALGATQSVSWKHFSKTIDAIEELKNQSYRIIAVEQAEEGIPLSTYMPDPSKKYALVFGHEMSGVSDEALALADQAIEVPQSGTKHSLNISVCAGVVMWEFYKSYLKTSSGI